MPAPKKRVLVLCTGNSARSQMAEGLINHLLGDVWEAQSAGTHPAGYVHELAIAAMAAIGIDISGQASKPVGDFIGQPFDAIITVCDQAAESCPLWLGQGRVVHIGFDDPAAMQGTTRERQQAFEQTRNLIQQQVVSYLRDWREEESPHGITRPFST